MTVLVLEFDIRHLTNDVVSYLLEPVFAESRVLNLSLFESSELRQSAEDAIRTIPKPPHSYDGAEAPACSGALSACYHAAGRYNTGYKYKAGEVAQASL